MILVLLVLTISLCGCGNNTNNKKLSGKDIDKKLLGAWNFFYPGFWDYDTNRWYFFYEDGTMTYSDISFGRSYEGKYTVSGNKIYCTNLGYYPQTVNGNGEWVPRENDAVIEYKIGTDDQGEYLLIYALSRSNDPTLSLEGADKFRRKK